LPPRPRSRRSAKSSTAKSATPPRKPSALLHQSTPRYLNLHRLPFAFSALRQPCTEAFGEALRRDAKARLHSSLGNRQRVVKLRGICKIPHAELREPLQRAGAPLPANHHIHLEFLRIHTA